ncbi:TPA: DUF1472 domain-containing protein, partial [Cronobacter sakazakii]|nr:DUF1472 domain-containing protein [Cronobacter sakazakii]
AGNGAFSPFPAALRLPVPPLHPPLYAGLLWRHGVSRTC